MVALLRLKLKIFTSCFLVKVQWHSVIHSLTSILAYWLCGGSISRRAKCIQIIKIAWTRFKMSMLGLLYWLAVLLSSYIVHINNTTTFNVCAQWIIFYQQFDFVKANSSRQEFLTYIVSVLFEKLSIELMSSLLVKQSCKTQKVVLVIRFWLPNLSMWFYNICRFFIYFLAINSNSQYLICTYEILSHWNSCKLFPS